MVTDAIAVPHPRPPAWLIDLVLATAVLAPSFAPFLPGELLPQGAVGWSAVGLAAVLVLLRRRWPVTVLVLLVALYTGTALAGQLLPGTGLAIAIAVFHVANSTSRQTSLLVGGVVMVVMVIVSVLAGVVHELTAHVFQFIVTVAFAAAAGDATRSRREYLIAVTERAERAERTREAEARRRVAEERLRIARDLHDAVAHQISVISLNTGVASSSLETRPDRARQALVVVRQAARSVLGEIGDLLRYLRTDDGDTAELPAVPQPGLNRLNDLLDSFARTGLTVTVRTEGTPGELPGTLDTVAYRAIQEGLTNAHKHGAEHRAHLLLDHGDDAVTVVVTNPVDPMDPSRPDPTGYGQGLIGLRERVALVRGRVETSLGPGGHRLAVQLPLHPPHPNEQS